MLQSVVKSKASHHEGPDKECLLRLNEKLPQRKHLEQLGSLFIFEEPNLVKLNINVWLHTEPLIPICRFLLFEGLGKVPTPVP